MPSNILVTVCVDEEWIEILKNLEKKCDWKIRYIVGFPEMKERVRFVFNGILFEDVGDFLTGLECAGNELVESAEISSLPEKPFDFDLLEKLSKYEFMIKYIINREFEKGSDRTNEIYFDLIKYWQKIIDFTKPSLIIVPWTPYTSREYVLYALSQVYGISFLSFRRATIGYYLNIPFSNPHGPNYEDVVFAYKHLKAISPSPLKISDYKIQPYAIQKIQKMADLKSANILAEHEKKIKSNAKLSIFLLVRDHSLNSLNNMKDRGIVELSNLFSNNIGIQKSIKSLVIKIGRAIRKIGSNFKNLYITMDKVKKLKTLKTIYDSYCIEPDYDRPYIFFPLNYQPEQTTAPFGNYAVYQYLPIEMIARSLPENWILYVKEHHTTFSPNHGGLRKRTKEYYQRISRLPNVALIPIETQSAVLIDHSKAVATITGSAGLEGILRGKPVLTFGFAWYNGCEGVFNIQNHTECKEVIEKIRQGFKVDPAQMVLFVQATEQIGAKVNYSFSLKNLGDESITREDTITNMTECISKWWKKTITNH